MEDLKHINRRKKCNACEKMYLTTIKQLEKQVEVLTEALSLAHLSKPIVFQVPDGVRMINSACLHDGCNHALNPVCNLYCPHCGPNF